MTQSCERVQQLLVDVGGDLDLVSDEDRRHVSACVGCGEVARGEAELAESFRAALPEYDERLEWAVLNEVAAAASRRRVIRLLPAAAALVLTMVGVLVLGGLPASGLLSALPAQCADGVLGVGTTVLERLGCVSVAIGSLADLVPAWLAAICGVLAAVGVLGLRRAAVRLARVRR